MSTYSAKGDQWTIEQNPGKGDATNAAGAEASTVQELTKDLMGMSGDDNLSTNVNDQPLAEELDFDMEFSDHETNHGGLDSDPSDDEANSGRSAPGGRKKKKKQRDASATMESPPSKTVDDLNEYGDGDESGDESVAMKGETRKFTAADDEEDDKTVGLSSVNDDDEDKTVAFSDNGLESDDDDDKTIAMSVVSTTNVLDEKEKMEKSNKEQEESNEIQNTTVTLPSSTTAEDPEMKEDNDDDLDETSISDMQSNENNLDTEENEDSEPKETIEAKSSSKSMEQTIEDSDNDDDEMEFDDMPTTEQEPSENEESTSESPKSTGENKDSSNEEEEEEVSSKDTDRESPESTPTNARTPRRSVRARKPRVLYSAERQESVLASAGKKKPKPKQAAKKSNLPTDKEWIAATDVLFVETEDKSAVTVKQIFLALEEQFQCKITKQLKTLVRNRLKALITGTVEPSCATQQEESESDNENDEGKDETGEDDDQSTESQSESEDSEEDADNEASDYSDEEEKKAERRKKKKKLSSKTKKKATASEDRPATRKTRPKRRRATAKAAAKIVEAHKLRQKKRAEELKVRNEEMQLNQTKEDEERQEAIAAKFETNTDELRLKRLEDRLDLLQRLDETRISVVTETLPTSTPPRSNLNSKEILPKEGSDEPIVESGENGESASANANAEKNEAMKADSESSDSDSDEDSSSDEEDLIIVGMKKPFKPLKPLHNNLPSRGLQLLEEIVSPKKTKKAGKPKLAATKKPNTTAAATNKKDGLATILSPNRSMGARFALRNALKQKQRKQGNRWLARELGYKTEEDHLKDCQIAAEQKRGLVVKLEQERLKANERKQLRERLILQEQQGFVENNDEDDPDDEAYVPEENKVATDDAEEEDEEMKMAKEIEKEARENDATKSDEGMEEDSNTFESSAMEEEGLETQPPMKVGTISSTEAEKDLSKETSPSESATPETELENSEKYVVEADASPVDENKEKTLPAEESPTFTPTAGNDVDGTEKNQFTDINSQSVPDESVVTPEKKETHSDDEGELEFDGNDSNNEEESSKDPNRPRNAGWQALLEREAEKLKKRKKRKGGLVEEEAEEEEEEEIAGLEDFGFSITKKNKKSDEEDDDHDALDEDDLKHVVDDVSDNEGDEDAGRAARKRLEQQEEKARHKEILRRMREGYDGRRGGIAGGGAGARGMHRFDQLVAADNRADAKRLGLLNDDELDSEDEKEGKSNGDADEEEDETALLDKMLKDRFLHRSDVNLEENFSEDEEEEEEETAKETSGDPDDEEVRTQERLAKRFAKRARMQRLEEMYGDSQEFSQQRLIDEDVRMKEELSKMRCGLLRRSTSLSRSSSLSRHSSISSSSNVLPPLPKRRQISVESSRSSSTSSGAGGSMFQKTSGNLSIALRASKKRKHRTSFLGGSKAVDNKETAGEYKVLSLGNVLFTNTQSSKSAFSNSRNSNSNAGKSKHGAGPSASSLFSKVSGVTK